MNTDQCDTSPVRSEMKYQNTCASMMQNVDVGISVLSIKCPKSALMPINVILQGTVNPHVYVFWTD